jgi:hypothetical protein
MRFMADEQTQSGSVNSNTSSKPKISHPLEPWRDQPAKCFHCQKVFPTLAALRAHLGHCKLRQLNRYFVVNKYLFTIKCNPLKRKILAINDEIQDTHNEKVLIGVLKGFFRYGLISNFTVTELTGWTKENPFFPDGIVKFPDLKKKLSSQNMQTFQNSVEKMKNEQINIQETQKDIKKE